MSRFFSEKYAGLVPYTPGEQPRNMWYIKLNTNESPYPPAPSVERAVVREACRLSLYSDPECTELRAAMARIYGVEPSQVIVSNGSDEVLNFAFMAFADKKSPLAFPDITYGFYEVLANLNRIPYIKIPLKEDFSIDPAEYEAIGRMIVIANPNAPTGICLSPGEIERIAAHNPGHVVIVDEAYVDFGAESVVGLTEKYDNLLVTGTFSKSRSMAGARLGFGIGNRELIKDLNTVRYSTNPYNVNRMTSAAGIASLSENAYYMHNCSEIIRTRAWTKEALESLGFSVLPSKANFLLAKSECIGGAQLYAELKKRGILVRHFDAERIKNYNRITIGTAEQMKTLIETVKIILEEAHI